MKLKDSEWEWANDATHPLLKAWKTPSLELLAQVGTQRLKKPGPDIHGRQRQESSPTQEELLVV